MPLLTLLLTPQSRPGQSPALVISAVTMKRMRLRFRGSVKAAACAAAVLWVTRLTRVAAPVVAAAAAAVAAAVSPADANLVGVVVAAAAAVQKENQEVGPHGRGERLRAGWAEVLQLEA